MWLLGFPDQALQIVERMIEHARSVGHVLSLCNALGQGACPVALWAGELAVAQRYLELLLDLSAAHDLGLDPFAARQLYAAHLCALDQQFADARIGAYRASGERLGELFGDALYPFSRQDDSASCQHFEGELEHARTRL